MLSTDTFHRIASLQPDIAAQLQHIMQLAPQTTDAELLSLCRSYIDAALQRQDWTPRLAV
ncbi:hypothetical protein [Oceanicoccus sagamiensis]|uniref:Uncharacterized protein n=1 Tax=Oceanicoccus sagamiensis TaxID=716816 RepID=A0A1X9NHE4_9GAMM|nr:hypothetical protein [Oceanicoccus sagamiensis]ARN75822.1 hypothetical protein BST96_17955 [Oceanicoccus sagamiensis]